MSVQSDAAKQHIENLLRAQYGAVEIHRPARQADLEGNYPQSDIAAFKEYRFDALRKWRLDYCVPSVLCANPVHLLSRGIIEIQGGNFTQGAHCNPAANKAAYDKYNAWAALGGRLWQFMPEQVIKAGRKTLIDEPILTRLPWV